MNTLNRMLVIAFGTSLALLGLVVLFGGGVSLPTRSPPSQFRFSGISLLLLGASPLAAGVTSLAIAFHVADRESRSVWWAITASIVTLGLAFVLAPKS